MNSLFELLRERGYKRTSLSVQQDNPAVRFYKRLGYRINDEKLDHARHEDYIMVKELFAMTETTEEKLACSLTAETTALLPYLPYLLQDFWELGSDPDVAVDLVQKHISLTEQTRILDLACGKGAVSVKLAENLRVRVKGIDLIPEFIEYAKQKAHELSVGDLCEFQVGDINEAVIMEAGYDCVVFGAVGNVLGNPAETLRKLKATLKSGGYILIDDGYLTDESKREDIKWSGDKFLIEQQWTGLFTELGLALIEIVSNDGTNNLASDSIAAMAAITARANELIEKHPEKRELFEGYVRSQQSEYDDIDESLVCVTWMLQKQDDWD